MNVQCALGEKSVADDGAGLTAPLARLDWEDGQEGYQSDCSDLMYKTQQEFCLEVWTWEDRGGPRQVSTLRSIYFDSGSANTVVDVTFRCPSDTTPALGLSSVETLRRARHPL